MEIQLYTLLFKSWGLVVSVFNWNILWNVIYYRKAEFLAAITRFHYNMILQKSL